MNSYDIYLFHYYSLEGLLNKLVSLNIEVKKYYQDRKYDFYLKIKRKYRKLIRDNFCDFKIVDKLGFINSLEKLVLKPITLVSLILAISLFFNLSNRVYKIEIKGDYPSIEGKLREYLNNYQLGVFAYNVNEKKLKEVTSKLKEDFNDELEMIELVKEGATLSLSYKKRRKALVIEGKKGSLYATKEGVIRGFALQSGVKNVKLYQFVKKGDLLVSDILITSSNESIVIGTIGKVFASTFYYIDVKTELSLEPAELVAYLLDKARNEVSKNLNSEDEYIESETILINDLENGHLRIYYVLYEDITI